MSSAPFHGIQRTVRTKLYESAGGILIWLVARSGIFWIWILFAGVMGFFVGGSFLAALQTPLPTNGAARQTTQTDTSEPILSRPTGSGMAGCPCGPVRIRSRRNHPHQLGLGGAKRLRLPHRLRQLGDIRRDPPRLVFREQLGCAHWANSFVTITDRAAGSGGEASLLTARNEHSERR